MDKKTFSILHTNDMHSSFIGMGPAADYTPFTLNDDTTRGGYNFYGLNRYVVEGTAKIPAEKKFSGEVNWVEIDVDKDVENHDHLITPEQRLQVAMAIQ